MLAMPESQDLKPTQTNPRSMRDQAFIRQSVRQAQAFISLSDTRAMAQWLNIEFRWLYRYLARVWSGSMVFSIGLKNTIITFE